MALKVGQQFQQNDFLRARSTSMFYLNNEAEEEDDNDDDECGTPDDITAINDKLQRKYESTYHSKRGSLASTGSTAYYPSAAPSPSMLKTGSRPPTSQQQGQAVPFYLGLPSKRSVGGLSSTTPESSPLASTPTAVSHIPRRSISYGSQVAKSPVGSLIFRTPFTTSLNRRASQVPNKLPPIIGSADAALMASTYTTPRYRNDFGSSGKISPQFKSYEDGGISPSKLNGGNFGTGRILVALRIRPMENREISCLQVIPPKVNTIIINNGMTLRTFDFDKIFGSDACQEDVFEETRMKQLVENGLRGYSCSVFCYGQTGAGKTHTLIGPPIPDEAFDDVTCSWWTKIDRTQLGLIPRCISQLFSSLSRHRASTYTVTFSAVQIYNEQLVDMFEMQRPVDIRWNREAGFYIEGMSRFVCTNSQEAISYLYQAAQQRFCRSTSCNPVSSRSHAIFSVGVESRQPPDNNETAETTDNNNVVIVRRGKLTFVDLAGSEKNSDIEDQQREANNINKGLLVLGKCIQALSRDELGHVPYRDSKLTKVLADSLGGQSFTVMIACISPSKSNIAETLTTLRYAGRARMIRTDPALRMNPLEQMMSGLHHELRLLRTENEQLRQQLTTMKTNGKQNDISNGDVQRNNDTQHVNRLQEAALLNGNGGGGGGGGGNKKNDNDFYDMLQEFMVENENLRQENTELQRNKEKIFEDCERIGRENENLKKQIDEITRMLRSDVLSGAGKRKGHAVNPGENGRTKALPAIPSSSQGNDSNNNLGSQGGTNNDNQLQRRRNTIGYPAAAATAMLPIDDGVAPLLPPQKVSNYPYTIPSSGLPLSNGYHYKPVRVPPPIDDNPNQPQPAHLSKQQQAQRQVLPPPPQQIMPPPQNQQSRFIDPYFEPSMQYAGRETNRKVNLRQSPIMKVALPAVLRPPVLHQSREPQPSQAELAIRENERLSQELKDLDRLIRHHYH